MTRNTFLVWSLLALLTVIDAGWLWVENMALAPNAVLLIALLVGGLGALAWFYTKIRPNPRLAVLAHTAAVTLGFMSATCILSYLAVRLQRPLIDSYLEAFDRATGLDWLALYHWLRPKAGLYKAIIYTYNTLIPQIFILQFIFTFRRQMMRAWELVWLIIVTCILCVMVSGIWPAAGTFSTFQVEPQTPYLAEFAAVRAGTLTTIDSTGQGMQGLVTFPSLHMALAVLLSYAVRGMPMLFPLLLVLNILIMFTTPFVGGHYFADLWGGAVLAVVAIFIVRTGFREALFAKIGKKSGQKKYARRDRSSPRA